MYFSLSRYYVSKIVFAYVKFLFIANELDTYGKYLGEKYYNYAVASSSTFNTYNTYPQPGREIIFSIGTRF